MRNRLTVALALFAATGLLSAAARAEMRTFWDETSKVWVSADDASPVYRSAARGVIPRELVAYSGPHAPKTIVVDTKERRLYFVMEPGRAIRYAIGVGREGYEWSGSDRISQKAEWPTWKPPAEMIAREKEKGRNLPEEMPGGLDNPLGARALYIGYGLYRIHGTNDPKSVGHAVSSGCIRLTNEDIADLYDRVKVGAKVVVLPNTSGVSAKAPVAVATVIPKPRLRPVALRTFGRTMAPVSSKPVVAAKVETKPDAAAKKPAVVATTDPKPVVVRKKKAIPAPAAERDLTALKEAGAAPAPEAEVAAATPEATVSEPVVEPAVLPAPVVPALGPASH